MNETLKGCPLPECASSDVGLTSSGMEQHFVECRDCGTSGPVDAIDYKAITRWNSLPRPDTGLREALEEIEHWTKTGATYKTSLLKIREIASAALSQRSGG